MNEKIKTMLPQDYSSFLQSIKQRIKESRVRVYRSVNHELIDLRAEDRRTSGTGRLGKISRGKVVS